MQFSHGLLHKLLLILAISGRNRDINDGQEEVFIFVLSHWFGLLLLLLRALGLLAARLFLINLIVRVFGIGVALGRRRGYKVCVVVIIVINVEQLAECKFGGGFSGGCGSLTAGDSSGDVYFRSEVGEGKISIGDSLAEKLNPDMILLAGLRIYAAGLTLARGCGSEFRVRCMLPLSLVVVPQDCRKIASSSSLIPELLYN